jgi:uncharacterized protein (DUF2236 family)
MEPATTPKSSSEVTASDLEACIAAIDERTNDRRAGVFGSNSISWKINRESALFLGAGRAALLQLAHPWVVAALDQHSSLLHNPISRFHNTFRTVFTMVFGSTDQAFRASRSLHLLHTRIRGKIPAPVASYEKDSPYEANQIPALRWVYATLIESAIFAYECVLPPLSDAERAAYYSEAKVLAGLFGIPSEALPPDWGAFKAYIYDMCQSQALGVSERSHFMAHRLLAGSGSWIKPPRWYRALTTEWMPPRFRVEFGLRFGRAEEVSAARARWCLPRVYRTLPAAIRFIGPYHEAQARLIDRTPDLLTRTSNRFWIGEAKLPFRE